MRKTYITLFILSILMVSAVIYGVAQSGTPTETRDIKLDQTRSQNLANLIYLIQNYYNNGAQVPDTLVELNNSDGTSQSSLTDPDTKQYYEYKKTSAVGYILCANFKTSSKQNQQSTNTNIYVPAGQTYIHDKGHVCYSETVTDTYNLNSPNKIQATVYVDSNKNGRKDEGERGYSGANMAYFQNGSGAFGTTASDGTYIFYNLQKGYNTLVVQVPNGYRSIDPLYDNGFINYLVKLPLSTPIRTDFGIYPGGNPIFSTIDSSKKYKLSGMMFIDSNKNGIKDSSENGFKCDSHCKTGRILIWPQKLNDDLTTDTTVNGMGLTVNDDGSYSTKNATDSKYLELTAGIYHIYYDTRDLVDYEPTTPPDMLITLTSDKVVNFGVAPISK